MTGAGRRDMIVEVIREYTAEYGFAPSVRDIMERVELATPSAVHYHLRALAKAGRIVYSPETARSIRVVGNDTAESILRAVMLDRRVAELAADTQDRIGRYFTGRMGRVA